jgi:hypothetical protein
MALSNAAAQHEIANVTKSKAASNATAHDQMTWVATPKAPVPSALVAAVIANKKHPPTRPPAMHATFGKSAGATAAKSHAHARLVAI